MCVNSSDISGIDILPDASENLDDDLTCDKDQEIDKDYAPEQKKGSHFLILILIFPMR